MPDLKRSSPLPGKKGICFTLRKEDQRGEGTWVDNIPKILAVDPYWCYSWGFDASTFQIIQDHLRTSTTNSSSTPKSSDIVWIPMAWGGSTLQNLNQRIETSNVKDWIRQGQVQLMLGFNEPDRKDQSNMSVETAISLWPTLESLNVPLVSPAAGTPGGEWMEQFMKSSRDNGYRVDYVAIHWYGGPNFDAFRRIMTEYHTKFQVPLIITEFAPADWQARSVDTNRLTRCKVLEFMKLALPWLESTDWIIGYSWFPFPTTSSPGCMSALFDCNGNLTTLGRYYKSVRSDNIHGDQSIVI
jgi:Glycosyl hydrolase catalytic core